MMAGSDDSDGVKGSIVQAIQVDKHKLSLYNLASFFP
jgi:hypothetical protein